MIMVFSRTIGRFLLRVDLAVQKSRVHYYSIFGPEFAAILNFFSKYSKNYHPKKGERYSWVSE